MRALRDGSEAALFAALLGVARFTPRAVLRGVGSVLGMAGYALDRRHRRISLQNLRRAFHEELTAAERKRIARASWRHFGRITLETLAFPRLSDDYVERKITIEGQENIELARRRDKGVLAFTAHFGHWELAAVVAGYLGHPVSVVVRPLDNPRLERMLSRLRGSTGNRVIHTRRAVREMLRALSQKRGVALAIDQDARQRGVFVPFFGHPASTTPSLATLALRTDAPVLPVYGVPEPGGRYRVVFEPAVPATETGDREADVLRLTAEYTAIVERWVRQYPSAYLWMHRRWKTRSPEETNP